MDIYVNTLDARRKSQFFIKATMDVIKKLKYLKKRPVYNIKKEASQLISLLKKTISLPFLPLEEKEVEDICSLVSIISVKGPCTFRKNFSVIYYFWEIFSRKGDTKKVKVSDGFKWV